MQSPAFSRSRVQLIRAINRAAAPGISAEKTRLFAMRLKPPPMATCPIAGYCGFSHTCMRQFYIMCGCVRYSRRCVSMRALRAGRGLRTKLFLARDECTLLQKVGFPLSLSLKMLLARCSRMGPRKFQIQCGACNSRGRYI